MSAYLGIQKRISSLQAARAPVLIAVSKTQTAESVKSLYDLGHRDFGENYVQEWIEKSQRLKEMGCTEIRWHYIGRVQSNKIKKIIQGGIFAIHTVESIAHAMSISTEVKKLGCPPVHGFIEVNIDAEDSKSGVAPEQAPALAKAIAEMPGLILEGLMTIPSKDGNPAKAFSSLAELESRCRPHTRGGLSMGMSSDFEIALQNGATHLRIGTALFGPRK